MTKAVKINIVRWMVFALVLVLLSMLQNTRGLIPQIFGARALLLIPAVACLGMFEKETAGAILGLLGGFCWDTLSVQHTGFNSVFLLLLGCVCGLMVSHLMQNSMLSAFLLSAGGILVYIVLYWLFFLVIPGDPGSVYALLTFYLPTALYTFLTTPLLYLLFRLIRKYLRVVE